MSHAHDHREVIPRPVLIAAGIMIAVTILGSAWARWTGATAVSAPESEALAVRDLGFRDLPNGGIEVLEEGEVVDVIAPEQGGFLRGVLRALARQRMLAEVGPEAPFRVTHWADGRLSIEDPETRERIEVNAFGPDNLEAFSRLVVSR
jgi:putative photosynthetic complex assembly protein